MPPLHAIACLYIYKRAKNSHKARDFLMEMFPKLMASHRYFYLFRDPEKTGLVYIRHPWESGLDNSPSWDKPLRNMEIDKTKLPKYERKDLKHGVPAEQRPSDDDYDRYVYLVDLFRRSNYDETKIYAECPFLVQDVLFNSILGRANRDLMEIGGIIGQDVKEVREWLEQTSKGISERNKILLSQIFNWYERDFGKKKDICEFVLRYLDPDDKTRYLTQHMEDIEVEYLFYDWNLNH